MLPPSVLTVIRPGSRPLLRSTTSNCVSVQISPRSKKLSAPRHRSRATAVACFASSSKRIRASVVALAATARSASPTKNRIHKNRRRCAKLISLDLQGAARSGLVQIGVVDEERAGTRRGARWNLQCEEDDAEPRGLLRDHRDVARAGDRVRHADVESALRKQADVYCRRAARGPLQWNRIAAQRARIAGNGERTKRRDIQIHVVAGHGHSRRCRIYNNK